ncbi:MAG: recombinase family protein [Bacillota bacterium]
MMEKTKQYCIYLRKSRADAEAEARGEGETLARHEAALLSHAGRMGLPVTAIRREIVSGETICARPVMQQLLSEVESGLWDGVLVMEVERLARGDTIDQGIIARAFMLSHTKIITPAKTYDPDNEYDEEYFEFGLFMSRREYKMINRRLQRGREASAMEGKYIGSVPPFGYKRVKLENQKGYSLVPDPDTAPVVKLIFDLYTKGEASPGGNAGRLGVARLARRLNALGVKPQRAPSWTTSILQPILRNPVYAGKIRYRGRPAVKAVREGSMTVMRPRMHDGCAIVDGLHPPLVNTDTWNRAQEYLYAGHPRGTKSEVLKNPLAGLVFCGVCGRRMVRKPLSHGAADTLLCPAAGCPNVSSGLHMVEARVLQSLKTWLKEYKPDIKNAHAADYARMEAAVQDTLKRLEEAAAKLAVQTDTLHDLLEQGVYAKEVFLERRKALAQKTAELKQAKENAKRELQAVQTRKTGPDTIIPQINNILDAYAYAPSVKEKNDLLRSVIDRIDYIKTVRGGNGRIRDQKYAFGLTLYPKLPKFPVW